jgi:hypothetical protein
LTRREAGRPADRIAVAEVERKALDGDHWEHADYLATAISSKRMEAIALLEDEP